MGSDNNTQSPAKPYIIIADDDSFTTNIFKNELEKSNYNVAVVVNGEEAIKLAREKVPDLLLLDLIMPVKDGFETVSEMKSDETLRSIKIVVLSNLGQEEDVKKARELGAAGYLVKNSLSLCDIPSRVKEFIEGGK